MKKKITSTIDLIGFLIIYIYCFVYMYKEETQVSAFALQLFVQILFMMYCCIQIMQITNMNLSATGSIVVVSIMLSVIFQFISLVLFFMLLSKMKTKFNKVKNEPLYLPPKYEKILELFKRLFISSFCLTFISLLGYQFLFFIINKSASFSEFYNLINLYGWKFYKNPYLIILFFAMVGLANLGISTYQIYLGHKFFDYSRKIII